jgi:hypothetical protein
MDESRLSLELLDQWASKSKAKFLALKKILRVGIFFMFQLIVSRMHTPREDDESGLRQESDH